MTLKTNARIAGFTFLFYIVVGITSMVLFRRATGGEEIAARLASIAQHATDVRLTVLLGLFEAFSALVLAVTLYAITREQDADLAMLAMICRVCEGLIGGLSVLGTLSLLWLATSTGAAAANTAAAHTLGAYLLRGDMAFTATFFAVGSTLFSYLFLRGRMIPGPLAWLGVVGSALLVVGLPLQLAGFFRGLGVQLMWLPVAVFELTLGPWLLIKGVATNNRHPAQETPRAR